ncbi:MAG: rod shape-determining protein MreC [candidate division KSB1 bacterium]|jgi:rod shape-determining protein MreC|nr:rod shape-determining protein MreC [candidate division KSB1 bacterium]
MQSSLHQSSGHKDYVVLLITVLFSLLLILFNKSSQVEAIKQNTLSIRGAVQQRFAVLNSYIALREENSKLRLQNTRLSLENSRMRTLGEENARLRNLLGYRSTNDYELIPSSVIGAYSTMSMNYIILDKGEKDGVQKDMPIVLPEKLVGKIYRVSESKSMGHIIADKNFRVSARIMRSGVNGILKYQQAGNYLLTEVPNRSDLVPGDSVFTSGYSYVFPEGLMLGTVKTVLNKQGTLFMDVRIEPVVDFGQLKEVMILKREDLK